MTGVGGYSAERQKLFNALGTPRKPWKNSTVPWNLVEKGWNKRMRFIVEEPRSLAIADFIGEEWCDKTRLKENFIFASYCDLPMLYHDVRNKTSVLLKLSLSFYRWPKMLLAS